jgi:hypothetical protein
MMKRDAESGEQGGQRNGADHEREQAAIGGRGHLIAIQAKAEYLS